MLDKRYWTYCLPENTCARTGWGGKDGSSCMKTLSKYTGLEKETPAEFTGMRGPNERAQYANQTHPTGNSAASLGPVLETSLGSSLVWCSPLIITHC